MLIFAKQFVSLSLALQVLRHQIYGVLKNSVSRLHFDSLGLGHQHLSLDTIQLPHSIFRR